MNYDEIPFILEAILFSSGDSVPAERIAKVLGLDTEDILSAADALEKEYSEKRRGIRLVRMENRLQIVSAPDYCDYINRTLEKFTRHKLSPTASEVLSIIAYFQPITRSRIEQLRGADSSYTVSVLTEKGLIAPCGRLDVPGRPVLYGTTEQFLRVMGITDLKELPPLPDISTDEGIRELQSAIENVSGEYSEQLELIPQQTDK